MKKKILLNVTIYMSVGSVILCLLAYYIFGIVDNADAASLVSDTFISLKNQIEISQDEVDNMIKQFGEDNIAKAKALSIIIYQNKNSLYSGEALEEVRVALNADEILVTDSDGDIVTSTTPFSDFNIESHIVFKEFAPGLTDRSFTKIYNMIQNDKVTQYVCCSRFDTNGIVIMKTNTKYISKSLQYAGISNVISGQSLVSSGDIFIINSDEWKYLSHTDNSKIGEIVQLDKDNFKLTEDSVIRKFPVTVNGYNCELYYQNYQGNLICITLPKSKIYIRRNYVCGSIIVAMVVIIIIGFLALRNKLIHYKNHIIEKIKLKE